jgi:hypothetical protein
MDCSNLIAERGGITSSNQVSVVLAHLQVSLGVDRSNPGRESIFREASRHSQSCKSRPESLARPAACDKREPELKRSHGHWLLLGKGPSDWPFGS